MGAGAGGPDGRARGSALRSRSAARREGPRGPVESAGERRPLPGGRDAVPARRRESTTTRSASRAISAPRPATRRTKRLSTRSRRARLTRCISSPTKLGLPIHVLANIAAPGHSVARLHATPAESGRELHAMLRHAAASHARIRVRDGVEVTGLVKQDRHFRDSPEHGPRALCSPRDRRIRREPRAARGVHARGGRRAAHRRGAERRLRHHVGPRSLARRSR